MPRSKKCSVPAATEPGPVTADEARRLFVILEPFDAALLAVSGGSDSMALMWLAARWVREIGWQGQLHVAVVDHGLRAEAADEARFVMDEAEKLGLTPHTLTWAGPHPRTGIPAAAREARYALLTRVAGKLGAVLVTAHTQDDQAETVLMRLARGSGVDGLSGMEARSMRHGVKLLRPLLGISREQLRATLREAGVSWIDDPTNENMAHERVRMRKALDVLQGVGLTRQAIALSASRLGRAELALEVATRGLMRVAVRVEANSFACISMERLMHGPAELQVRVIIELARIFGGGQEISLSGAERVRDWSIQSDARAMTFAGCRFARRAKTIIVGREAARVKPGVLPVDRDAPMVWDARYQITVPKPLLPAEVLRVADTSGLQRPSEVPDFVWRGLPVLKIASGQLFTPVRGSDAAEGPAFRLIHAPNGGQDHE
jgi:tRNA(Ile)-lysidine synthase